MATAPADALPLWYPPQVTTLQEKLDFAVYRKRFIELLARVGSVVPLGFAPSEPPLIELSVAWHECVRRDARAVTVIPEGHMGNAGWPTLGNLARRHLGTPKEGFLSIFGTLPWVRVAILQPHADWPDALWQGGAQDFLFLEPSGDWLFAVITDGHDHEVVVITDESREIASRAAGRV
jgi:hypothetical protein